MKFKVSFSDVLENCESEDQAYDALLKYLSDCVNNGDVTAFRFEPIGE